MDLKGIFRILDLDIIRVKRYLRKGFLIVILISYFKIWGYEFKIGFILMEFMRLIRRDFKNLVFSIIWEFYIIF